MWRESSTMEQLSVWMERFEGFALVGTLGFEANGDEWFEYDDSFLRAESSMPIYPVLPLREGRFTSQQTRAAFASLGPEGAVGHDIRTALRAGREAVTPILARLNHETVGALAFGKPGEPLDINRGNPKTIDLAFFEEFSRNPDRVAFDTLLDSRLSLNGAVSKFGATEHDGVWELPQGLCPSTHIIKAGSPAFPHQMLNEALCMRCALACGFDDAAETKLVAIDGAEPVLISKRFDRLSISDRPNGLPPIMRLHQADFCQVLGVSVDALKYTPSDEMVAGYTTSVAEAISRESSERYGDRSYVFDMLAFDYLIGNCDNHLKNLSLTWSFDWQSKAVSPIYDITCTTVYEDLSREMGMGIGRRRLIDAVQAEDFPVMARQLGIGWRQASDALAEMAESICTAILDAAHDLDAESGVDAGSFAEKLVTDCRPRTEVALRASLLRG